MPKKKAPPKKIAAGTKKTAPKKRPTASKHVEIKIDLGPVAKATPAQIRRLKALVKNHVLTWVKSDVQSDLVPPITAHEFFVPPSVCDDDDDDA